MKTKTTLEDAHKHIHKYCEKTQLTLDYSELKLASALCRAAYNMGLDDGKQNSTLELTNADEILKHLHIP